MRDDLIQRIPVIDGRLENLHAFPRNPRPPQPPDQLFALPRKHRSAYDLNPADVSSDDVHEKNPEYTRIRRCAFPSPARKGGAWSSFSATSLAWAECTRGTDFSLWPDI